MAHEKSVTIKVDDGIWINAPSVIKVQGKSKILTEDQVFRKLNKGEIKPHGVFKSLTSALDAAKKRSKGAK